MIEIQCKGQACRKAGTQSHRSKDYSIYDSGVTTVNDRDVCISRVACIKARSAFGFLLAHGSLPEATEYLQAWFGHHDRIRIRLRFSSSVFHVAWSLGARIIAIAIFGLVIPLTLDGVAAAQGLPVIPNAAGFGIMTPAGRGGQIHRVTNLNASGPGSLRACIDAIGPRVCIFEVSGEIRLSQIMPIRNPNITIAGQTAPSPGIMLRGASIAVVTSDVLIQHIRIRIGDDANGPDPVNRDAMNIESWDRGAPNNVVIDHNSFSWSIDELLTTWYEWDNITLRHNIFAEPLNESIHPQGIHGFGTLFGPTDGRISAIGNLNAHVVDRNPLSFASNVVLVNNVVYNAVQRGFSLVSQGLVTNHTVVGNILIDGPDSNRYRKSFDLQDLISGSRVYLDDNVAPEHNGLDQWSMVQLVNSPSRQSLEVNSPPVWPVGLVAQSTADGQALNWVLENVGARPLDRDTVDERIVSEVRSRTGQIINCVEADGSQRCAKNGGGWPQLVSNSRPLSVPNDPNGDDDGDGYTNLEEWLHGLAAALEAGGSATSDNLQPRPKPPANLQIAQF